MLAYDATSAGWGLTSNTGEELSREALNLTVRKWNE